MTKIGQLARELRGLLDLTQIEMAELLGVTNVHLSRVESDLAFPSRELIDRYAEIFGVDIYVAAWCRESHDELSTRVQNEAVRFARSCDSVAKLWAKRFRRNRSVLEPRP